MKNYPYSEILRTLGPNLGHKGGTQVDDFTKGFIKGTIAKTTFIIGIPNKDQQKRGLPRAGFGGLGHMLEGL